MDIPSPAEVKDIINVMYKWDRSKISQYRRMLLAEINGRHFLSVYFWPHNMKKIFWSKPMTSRETFMLLCFLLGNKCHIRLALYWVCSSINWCRPCDVDGRCKSITNFFRDFKGKQNTWFYFDLQKKVLIHMDGSRHQIFGYNGRRGY